MDKIKVTKIGYLGVATHRYVDVLSDDRIEKFRICYFDNERNNILKLIYEIKKYFPNLLNKLEVIEFPWYKILGYKNKFNIDNLDFIPTALQYFIKNELIKTDILWIGDNDFDNSFHLYSFLFNYFNFDFDFVLTLKETRFDINNQSELLVLKNAKKIILPHEGYIDFFKEKYRIDIKNKTYYADIDFRSKLIQKIIDNLNTTKLSEIDGQPHVVILAGRAIWDKNEPRSFGRYYYVDVINDLINNGFVVHLHTNNIIKSSNDPVSYLQDKNNPYYRMMINNPKKFIIEPPLDLNIIENYNFLKKYDFGLLHSGVIGDSKFEKFESINIPNRYYEYLSAGVKPICKKGIFKYFESLNNRDVLFYNSINEVNEYFNKEKKEIVKPKNYFSDLLDLIF